MFYFKHPQQVCMTYFQHMRLSLYFSYILWKGSIQSFIHALFPDLYIRSTTDISSLLIDTLKTAGCHTIQD